MEIQKNMADILCAAKNRRGKSLTEFAEELEISRSHLQELLKQSGNPRIETVEHIADMLGVDVSVLIGCSYNDIQFKAAEYFTGLIECAEILPYEKRLRFSELFAEIMKLWDDEK